MKRLEKTGAQDCLTSPYYPILMLSSWRPSDIRLFYRSLFLTAPQKIPHWMDILSRKTHVFLWINGKWIMMKNSGQIRSPSTQTASWTKMAKVWTKRRAKSSCCLAWAKGDASGNQLDAQRFSCSSPLWFNSYTSIKFQARRSTRRPSMDWQWNTRLVNWEQCHDALPNLPNEFHGNLLDCSGKMKKKQKLIFVHWKWYHTIGIRE